MRRERQLDRLRGRRVSSRSISQRATVAAYGLIGSWKLHTYEAGPDETDIVYPGVARLDVGDRIRDLGPGKEIVVRIALWIVRT